MTNEAVPSPALPPDRVKEAVYCAYNRHLMRSEGNKAQAWDMTFHNLKHMGYDEADWDYILMLLENIKKEEIGGK